MVKWGLVAVLIWSGLAGSALLAGQGVDSPLIGVWSAELPEYGTIALDVRNNGRGQVSGAAVWWLVESIDLGLRTTVDGSRLSISAYNHKRQQYPCLVLELTPEDTLKLLPGGVIPDPVPPPFTNLVLNRNRQPHFWHDLTSFLSERSEYNRGHADGALKSLPPTWPATLAVATSRLFASDDHILSRVLALPTVPSEFLQEVYGWTQDKPQWNEGPAYIPLVVFRNPNCKPALLEKAWQHPSDSRFWLAAAMHSHANPEWRSTVVDRIMSSSSAVKSSATWAENAPPELYQRLIHDGPITRSELVFRRNLPAYVYENLAHEFPAETRLALARNDAIPTALIEEFAASDDRPLRLALIDNRRLAPAARARLVRQVLQTATPSEYARYASDRDAPAEFLARCAEDFDPQIRACVADNPNTDRSTLLHLANDEARATAQAARNALGQRFPTAAAESAVTLVPLDTLEVDCSPVTRFRQAIDRSDLPKMTQLADYFRAKGELESVLSATGLDVIKGYRPAVMDFFLTQGFNQHHVALTDLAAQCGGDQRWLAYFRAHGAFEKSLPGRAYQAAIESGRIENVAGLIRAGVDMNQSGGNGASPLHLAVARRNIAMVAMLLDAGARTDVRDYQRRTPLELAVLAKFIPAVRALDRDKKYGAIVEQFTKEFPDAPKDSPFLGNWTNNRDGFSTVVIRLDGEGTGLIAASVGGALVAWRAISEREALAYMFNENGMPDKTIPIHLRLNSAGTELIFDPEKGEKQTMHRTK